MCEGLVAQFVEHVKAQHGGDSAGDGIDADGMFGLELTVQEHLVRLGRAAVQRLVQEVGGGHQGARVNHGGEVYRFNGYRPKTVHGLYGIVTVLRAYYASSTGKGLAPLDEQLGIGHGQTPACEYHMAHFAGSEPYQSGRSHFNLIFRPDGEQEISLHKIEHMIDALGQRLEALRQQEIEDAFERGAPPVVENQITGTMVVCIDAGKAPTKGNERVDDDKKKRYDREFRDVKVASISALTWDRKRREARCTNTSYVLGIEHADEFFARIWVEMNRRCRDLSKLRLVFIGDGAEWIWPRVADLDNADSWRILDFCHAADHLAQACRILYGDDTRRFGAHFKQWRAKLRDGRAGELIDELNQLRDADGDHDRDLLQGEINYLEANRQRMDYQRYRDERLPIGSGTVESACKNVVAARMKGSGMTWTLPGAQHMLQIRASLTSGRLARDFQRSLPARVEFEAMPDAA